MAKNTLKFEIKIKKATKRGFFSVLGSYMCLANFINLGETYSEGCFVEIL